MFRDWTNCDAIFEILTTIYFFINNTNLLNWKFLLNKNYGSHVAKIMSTTNMVTLLYLNKFSATYITYFLFINGLKQKGLIYILKILVFPNNPCVNYGYNFITLKPTCLTDNNRDRNRENIAWIPKKCSTNCSCISKAII